MARPLPGSPFLPCVATRHPTWQGLQCWLTSFPNDTSERSFCPFDFSQELRHLKINGAGVESLCSPNKWQTVGHFHFNYEYQPSVARLDSNGPDISCQVANNYISRSSSEVNKSTNTRSSWGTRIFRELVSRSIFGMYISCYYFDKNVQLKA